MIHLGDITKIDGHKVPVVDCIIGGSPCQDLSVAGKRAGLDGERSGLFMEQIRLVKEMREEDERRGNTDVDIRPRYMVWENVPGAFSSNKGEDFRIVLEETAKVADKNAVIPRPADGKWTTSGCIMGEGWSIAWRILDSQFFGTSDKPLPQRRRRIALVADFGGHSAPEILFVRTSLSGDIEPSEPKRKGTSSDAEGGFGEASSYGFPLGFRPENVRVYEEIGTTLCNGTRPSFTTGCIQPVGVDIYNTALTGDKACPLTAGGHTSTGTCPKVMVPEQSKCGVIADKNILDDQGGSQISVRDDGKCPTLRAETHGNLPCVMSPALAKGYKDPHLVCDVIALDRAAYNQGKNAQYDFEVTDKGINSLLVAKGPSAVCYGFDPSATRDVGQYFLEEMGNTLTNGTCPGHHNGVCVVGRTNYIVRRLSPRECERLQGFPDGWTDIGEWIDSKGKVHKTADSSRYKALGNSIAIPPWKWVLKRLCACYERDATMASLFDGIGGFPYIWEQLNGKGSCLWASEIEEFPMAVTKERFK